MIELSIYLFNSVPFCFIYFGALLLDAYNFIIVMLPRWIYTFILFFFNSSDNLCLKFYFSMIVSIASSDLSSLWMVYLFSSFYFESIWIFEVKLFLMLLFIYSSKLCLLIDMFNSFTLITISNNIEFMYAKWLHVIYIFYVFFVPILCEYKCPYSSLLLLC